MKIAKYAAPITALAAAVGSVGHLISVLTTEIGEHPDWLAAFGHLATLIAIILLAILLAYLHKRHIYVLKEVQRLTEIAKAAQTAADAAQAALKEIRDAGKELTT